MKKILLSYPRSGNHLVRFFIELLTETPTFGCVGIGKQTDVEIYKNVFKKKIDFNIAAYDKSECYHKFHCPPVEHTDVEYLILIVRNPREVLLRHHNYKMVTDGDGSFQEYFNIIDYYNNFTGKKLLLFYEDILTNKDNFINDICKIIDFKNNKKISVIENIEELFVLSSTGKNRSWGGFNSKSEINYYYKKIPIKIKAKFDNYLSNKLLDPKYLFIKEKYNL